jgi:transposase-like protein
MSNEKKPYSREFKAKVVLEAVSSETKTPQEIAEKYEISITDLLIWANEMDLSDEKLQIISEAAEGQISDSSVADEVDLESVNEIFSREIEYGAAYDYLNMKRLTFWSIFGTGFVLLTIIALINLYHFSTYSTMQQVSEQSEYLELQEIKVRDQETLSSFGVVDLENGIYRVPIDSIISRMAQDSD